MSLVAHMINKQILGSGNNGSFNATFSFAGELALNTGENRWYSPKSAAITKIEAWVSEAPTGAAATVVLKKNGTAFQTVTVPAGSTKISPLTVNHTLLATDYLTVDITTIGTTVKGKNLNVRITLQ